MHFKVCWKNTVVGESWFCHLKEVSESELLCGALGRGGVCPSSGRCLEPCLSSQVQSDVIEVGQSERNSSLIWKLLPPRWGGTPWLSYKYQAWRTFRTGTVTKSLGEDWWRPRTSETWKRGSGLLLAEVWVPVEGAPLQVAVQAWAAAA